MRKLIALALSLLLVCCAFAATAEEDLTIAPVTDGTWVQFKEHNFEICLPSDWNVMNLTQEQVDNGYFLICADQAMKCSFAVKYAKLNSTVDIVDVANEMIDAFGDADIVSINDIEFVSYTFADMDTNGLATLNGKGDGIYIFEFAPASDEAYAELSMQIAASINALD